jgi:hypothetical protein
MLHDEAKKYRSEKERERGRLFGQRAKEQLTGRRNNL